MSVCMCVLFIYTICVSIICASQEEPSEKKIHFLMSVKHSFNVIKIAPGCCEHITDGVNIYLYGCLSLLTLECNVCLCMCICVCLFLCDNKSEYQQKTTLCVRPQ